jgi:hypothetical protein
MTALNISDWLSHLYLHTDQGWLTLFSVDRSTGEKITAWHRIIDHEWAADEATTLAEHGCVWFGVAPRERKLPNGKRGGAADCLTLPAMWVDIDIASPVHAADDLPTNIDEAMQLCDSFPLPPTAIINSGHGLQAWWMLDEPAQIDDDTLKLLTDWGATWAELGRRHGWHVDNVFDAARVMRLPGTYNRKAEPVPVTIINSDWTRTYGVDDLAANMIEAPKADPQTMKLRSVPYIGPERPGDAYNAVTDPASVLESAGFHFDHNDSEGSRHYRAPHRPAKNETTGATVYADGHTTLWSTTFARQHGMDVRRPYDAYGLYTHIEHRGDWSAATKALRALGYGSDLSDPLGGIGGITHAVRPSVTTDEPPLPLGTSHRHGPAFPLEVLPDWIADQCREIAYAFQVPEDLPAMLALGSLSTILAGHVKVNLTGSAWVEHVNLYLVSALLPGSGKSPVFKVMTKPVLAVEKESRASAKKELNDYDRERRINEQRIKHHETIAVKGTKEEQRSAIEEISIIDNMLDRQVRPSAGHLVSEDITPEALVEELAANGGRMALLSSEGGVFDMMAGQYVDKGKATNLAVYLQGWSADSVRRKRTKGEAIVIDEALLTVCVTTQPGVVEALGANRELVTKGVPVRFMFSVPPSLVGYRDRRRVLEDIDSTINATYQETMTQIGLAALGDPDLRMLQLSGDAGDRFLEWDQGIEDQQRPGGTLAARAEWAAKLRATVLRCCGILHTADRSQADRVEIDVVERAIRLAEYWLAHADVVEKMWSDDQVTARARTIVRWSIDNNTPEFSLRDITVAKRGTFPSAEDAVSPLQTLVDRGWVTPLQDGLVEVMGRGTPSQRFRLREDAEQWLDCSAQPSQLPENDQVARVVMVVHENEVQIHPPLVHTLHASENANTPAQPSQPSQLAATGTDNFVPIPDDDDPNPDLPDLI